MVPCSSNKCVLKSPLHKRNVPLGILGFSHLRPGTGLVRMNTVAQSMHLSSEKTVYLHRISPRVRTIALVWFCTFMAISLVIWLYQQFDFAESLKRGVPIPDVVNIALSFDNLVSNGGLYQDSNQFFGLSLLFGWTWQVHPSLCFLVNTALMAWATKIYADYYIGKLGIPAWSIVGVLGNPYLALAMAGPNKEIPLMLLTLLYFKVVFSKRQYWLVILLCGATFMLREGYGTFLLGSATVLQGLKYRAKPYALIACIASVSIAILFGLLENLVPIFSKNAEVLGSITADNFAVGALAFALGLDPLTPIGGGVLFGLRLIYNVLSLAFFPVFETTNGIYWIGWAYWVFGLYVLVTIPACVTFLFTSKSSNSPLLLCAALVVATYLMVSVSLFVQPRYLMPILPIAMAVFACSPARVRTRYLLCALLLVGTVVIEYRLFDRVAPLPEPDTFATPSYVIGT